jgi:hypothetical protein
MSLAHELDNLVTTLQHKGFTMHPHLYPGLSQAQIQTALASFGLTPPPELYELYAWHDGIDDEHAPIMLFGEHQFLPLADVFHEYQQLMQHYGHLTSGISISQCLPFAGFQGSTLSLYCESSPILGLHHPVIEIYHDISIAFENVDRMIQTVNMWFASGVYDTEPVNEVLYAEIRQRINPRLPNKPGTL